MFCRSVGLEKLRTVPFPPLLFSLLEWLFPGGDGLAWTTCLDSLPKSVEGPWALRKESRSGAEDEWQPQRERAVRLGSTATMCEVCPVVPLLELAVCALPTQHAAGLLGLFPKAKTVRNQNNNNFSADNNSQHHHLFTCQALPKLTHSVATKTL